MCGVCGNMSTGRTLKPVAGLDELGGVRRQRRRVAGDVDDPRRRGLDDPAHDLLREAGARRVDDREVRACPRARRARAAPAARRRRRRTRSVISLTRAFSIASATAGSTISRPITWRARVASDSAIVPMPAVEVEDLLVPAQAGVLERDAVELLGHLGVGLEERLGRDQEVEVVEALGQLRRARQQRGLAAVGALAEVGGLRPPQAVGVDGGDEARRRRACRAR